MWCGIDFVDPQHRFDKAKECALVQMICNTLVETRMEEAMYNHLKIGLAKMKVSTFDTKLGRTIWFYVSSMQKNWFYGRIFTPDFQFSSPKDNEVLKSSVHSLGI